MYTTIRELHSIIRWVVLLVLAFALYWSWLGARRQKVWGKSEWRIVAALSGLVDLQLALGLILYFLLSPTTTAMYKNLLTTVQQPGFLLLGLLHPIAMFVAAVLLHQIKPQVLKMTSDQAKYKKMGLFVAISLIVIVVAIPWYL